MEQLNPIQFDPWTDPTFLDFIDGVDLAVHFNPQREISLQPTSSSQRQTSVADERYAKVARLWPATRKMPRLIHTMWRDIIDHRSDNLFLQPDPEVRSFDENKTFQAYPEYGFDEQCYQKLVRDYGMQIEPPCNSPVGTAGAQAGLCYPNNHGDGGSETSSRSGGSSTIRFPPREVFDVSLGLYFRRFHALMPFIHEPTFTARSTPTSLLFCMCLIGLCYLGDKGAKRFVHAVVHVGYNLDPKEQGQPKRVRADDFRPLSIDVAPSWQKE
jgi:hypothetical protein